MSVQDRTWHRLFSKSLYKNMKLPMGEMSFIRDFINDTRGDLHPLISKSEDCLESVSDLQYHITKGWAERLLGQYFPYASYEVTYTLQQGRCGFVFHIPGAQASVICSADSVTFSTADQEETLPLPESCQEATLIVTCRKQYFDVYFLHHEIPTFFHSFSAETFEDSIRETVFQRGWASVYGEGTISITASSFYIDCGVGQADLRPVHYENGEVFHENGKVYLTFSIRMQENGFQAVFSWVPGTSQLELTGAIFFDCGDGCWRNYLASSLLYDRRTKIWYVWVSAFENQVRLACGSSAGDPRFGVNVMDVIVMEPAGPEDTYESFKGYKGDEDPDFYYNEEEDLWYMAICRLDPVNRKYRYAFFTSKEPLSGYQYIGCANPGSETGGGFVTVDGERLFVCGNDFDLRANYRIYKKDGMFDAVFDYDDGGFRGWGSIIPVQMGSRRRYFWVTFDRHKGSDYNWSYGNIYCFEGIL